MTFTTNRQNEAVVGTIPVGVTREIRVVVGDYMEKPYVYAELWDTEAGEPRGGLTLRPNVARQLGPLIDKALDEVRRRQGGQLEAEAPQYAGPYEPIDRGRGGRRR